MIECPKDGSDTRLDRGGARGWVMPGVHHRYRTCVICGYSFSTLEVVVEKPETNTSAWISKAAKRLKEAANAG